jgi:histidinol-phosphate aminotransferase
MTIDVRPSYRDLRLYSGDTGACAVDLSDNTNLWGAPPVVQAALAEAAARGMRGYPEPYSESLKDAIAAYAGVGAECVVTGAGSDDVLDCAFRALAEPGDRVAFISPTFVMVPVFAKTNGLEPIAVPLTAAYDGDVDQLIATGARIIYLCSPNNPTGTALSRAAIEAIVERAPGFVIVDEAYVDFARTDVVDLLERSPRLVIARTFSKAFGLAGLRVGYALAAPAVATELEKARGPYKVSAIGSFAARLALVDGLEWVREQAARAITAREALRAELERRGIQTPASSSNFLFAPINGAGRIAAAMRARGVAVRPFANLPRFNEALDASNGEALRITVGPADAMARMLAAFDEARG